jgi:diguanylate cyclase (GGDEF)-like protein
VGELKNLQSTQAFQFDFNGDRQFVRVSSFADTRGLDWLVVTVVPRTDVMGEIQAGTQTTIGLCLMAVFATIGLNTSLGKRLARPIGSLSRASQEIAQGNFDRPLVRSGIRELATLSEFFKLMSQEIQESRRQLEDYSKSLEQKVEERTEDLQREIDRRIAAQTALHQANEELQRIAYLDGLTHIPNRRQFDERLLQEWQRMSRQGAPLSIVLCDVDFFKQFNDTYGHQIGDECLQYIAKAIADSARRAGDLAARYGGEEFVAILPDTDASGAQAVARSIQTRVKTLAIPHVSSLISDRVTLSMGVATIVPSKSTTPAQLMAAVDRALYRAKVSGRDRLVEVVL